MGRTGGNTRGTAQYSIRPRGITGSKCPSDVWTNAGASPGCGSCVAGRTERKRPVLASLAQSSSMSCVATG